MKEFIESAHRDTNDSGIVRFLSTALIAATAALVLATSFALV